MTNIWLTNIAIQKAIWCLGNFVILFLFFIICPKNSSEIKYLQIKVSILRLFLKIKCLKAKSNLPVKNSF